MTKKEFLMNIHTHSDQQPNSDLPLRYRLARTAAALAITTCIAVPGQAADSAIGQLSVLGDATVGQASDAVGISYNVMVYFSGDPVVLQENTSAVLRLSDGVGSVSVLGNGSFSVSGDSDKINAEVDASEIEFSFARDKQFVVATDCFTITSTESLAPATGSIGSNGNLIVTNGQVAVRSQDGNSQVATTGQSISCDRIAGATVAANASDPVSGGQFWQATVAATAGIAAVAISRNNNQDEETNTENAAAATGGMSNGLAMTAGSGASMMAAFSNSGGGKSASAAKTGSEVAAEAAPQPSELVAEASAPTPPRLTHGRGKRDSRIPRRKGSKPGHGGKHAHGVVPPNPAGSPASPTKGKK